MDIQKVDISLLNPAKYNPRKDLQPGDTEYIKLKQSIEHFGYVEPIIVNKRNNVVVGGHQRLKVLIDLGYKDADVVYVDLNDTDEKALNIALNKISGDWDVDKLEDLLRDIKLDTDFDIELTGFDNIELESILNKQIQQGKEIIQNIDNYIPFGDDFDDENECDHPNNVDYSKSNNSENNNNNSNSEESNTDNEENDTDEYEENDTDECNDDTDYYDDMSEDMKMVHGDYTENIIICIQVPSNNKQLLKNKLEENGIDVDMNNTSATLNLDSIDI